MHFTPPITDRKIRFALVGCGRIAQNHFAAMEKHADRCEVVDVCDINPAALTAAVEKTGARGHSRLADLLKHTTADCVILTTPSGLHPMQAIEVAEAGKHVLVEKPIALSVDEVDQMAAAARDNHVIIQEAFMYRFNPQTVKVNQLMADGVLGELRFMRSGFQHIHNRADDYRLKPEFGGGVLWDMGCYPVSFFQMITGSAPIRVTANKQIGPTGIDRAFFATMQFLKNVTSQLAISFDLPSYANVELHGTEGILFVSSPFKQRGPTGIILKRGKGFQNFAFNTKDPFTAEVESMAQAVSGKAEVVVSLHESRRTVSTIRMLHEAAAQ